MFWKSLATLSSEYYDVAKYSIDETIQRTQRFNSWYRGAEVAPDTGGASRRLVGVNVTGYLRDESGWGEAARGYVRALRSLRVTVALNDLSGLSSNRSEDRTLTTFDPDHPYDVNLTNVLLANRSPGLWGRHIDVPKAGTTTEASALDLAGWVLGKSSPAVAIEMLEGGKVLRRLPLDHRRPDIAQAFPGVPGAEESGFRTTVSALGTTAEFELGLRAVLRDQSRVPLGAIRGRRRWAEGGGVREAGMALVSVVIPCYNQARFLGEAIESVLKQSYPHFEVVVVDDGSTDNTFEVASRYPGVRCIRQENRGLAGARNTGIRRSRGGYLVFLDADDRLLPDALEVGLRELKANPECAFVSGRWKLIASDGSVLSTPPQPLVVTDHYEALLRSCYISTPAAVMFQRTMLEYLGGFDTAISPSADYDLYMRISRQCPVHHHGEAVAEYRRHGTNMTRDPARMLQSEVTVLRRQRKYVGREKQYWDAYKVGVKHSQVYFGSSLVEETRAYVQEKRWHRAIGALSVLIRYHPRGFASVLRHLLTGKGT